MPNRHPQLMLIPAPTTAASPDEAAAIVAALERFMRATAPRPAVLSTAIDPWRRVATIEGVERDPGSAIPNPWINT